MDFNEFLKETGYKENPIVSYDRWLLNMFDYDRSGALSVQAERKAMEKYSRTHNLQVEYNAYVANVEAGNAQRMRQLMAQWEAQAGQENYKAAQSELKTRAEREAETEAAGKETTKKLATVALVVVAALFLFSNN